MVRHLGEVNFFAIIFKVSHPAPMEESCIKFMFSITANHTIGYGHTAFFNSFSAKLAV